MVIFVEKKSGIQAVNFSYVYSVKQVCNIVKITFNTGDFMTVGESISSVTSTIELVYSSADVAVKVMREYFKACKSGENAFYFSDK